MNSSVIGEENIAFGDYLNLITEIAETKKPRHFPMSDEGLTKTIEKEKL
jgi:hypothetical protein